MDLDKKLSRLTSAGPGGTSFLPPDDAAQARRARIERLRSTLVALGTRPDATPRRRSPGTGPDDHLPGEVRETEHGPVHVVDRWLEPHHCHGRVAVRSALGVSAEVVARLALDPALEGFDARRMVLLDTETTGLATGAGTIPFLVGMAWFEDESLRVQQLFLRRPGEEGPMLRVLADRLRWADCIVTYNGKAFDWPLLRTRFVMNRVPLPDAPPHLDLLSCARRVLKPRLEGLRLVRVESEVLGMVREGDVDGSLIPSLYFGYLHGEGSAALIPVIEHNANDLIALAAVLARLSAHFETLRPEDDPRDHLAYARLAVRCGDEPRAARFAEAAARGGGDPDVTVDGWLLCAWLARRRRDQPAERDALEAALREALAVAPDRAPEVHLALAKLCEHRLRRFADALHHAEHARAAEEADGHERRLARLRRRLARAAGA